eukprot:TRINITY_DN39937_c0_g1_i2.p1 TRINITY_DN39937_c0_g1~~TRINITY_DN39937_c0_g1_i2.p1  ORF type:complete len:161 (-),score=55.13 TRINITY_DN39937_c0_g1_i2:72-554(-)
MAGCSHTMSCGSLNSSMLEELDIQQLVESNCEMMGVCGERIILVLADLVMCLTGACEENEFPDWARPATCAAIAITALVFFSLMYFGKSCSEARVKVSERRPSNRTTKPSSADGPQWDRLKISMLANRPPTPEVSRHGVANLPMQTRPHDVTVQVQDTKL